MMQDRCQCRSAAHVATCCKSSSLSKARRSKCGVGWGWGGEGGAAVNCLIQIRCSSSSYPTMSWVLLMKCLSVALYRTSCNSTRKTERTAINEFRNFDVFLFCIVFCGSLCMFVGQRMLFCVLAAW